jgi:hypothetical protein
LSLEWGILDRDDAVSLLREIVAACESFHSAQAVAITFSHETKNYVLIVNWTPSPLENERLNKILEEHSLEAVTTNGRTVFSPK